MSAALVEAALAAAEPLTDACVVVVTERWAVDLRWANTAPTTNGSRGTVTTTVAAVVKGRLGTVSRAGVTLATVGALVDDTIALAGLSPVAGDVRDLPTVQECGTSSDFTQEAPRLGASSLPGIVAGLADAFALARHDDYQLFGFAEHELTTTWLGTSAGVRLRHTDPDGRVDLNARGKSGSGLSVWAGLASRDPLTVDVSALHERVRTRLEWSRRGTLTHPAQPTTVVLPPSAVADLLVGFAWELDARGAAEGRSVFSAPDGGSKVGESIAPAGFSIVSDPHDARIGTTPFVTSTTSGDQSTVFDAGLPLRRTAWVQDGTLSALAASRSVAAGLGVPVAPAVGTLSIDAGGTSDEAALVAGLDDGLLLTCLWYIREVDPTRMLVTGLTRDGVFAVKGGEVVGQVHNFRFNESPYEMLGRITGAGAPVVTLPREWADYFRLVTAPPLRIEGFGLSSVSEAV